MEFSEEFLFNKVLLEDVVRGKLNNKMFIIKKVINKYLFFSMQTCLLNAMLASNVSNTGNIFCMHLFLSFQVPITPLIEII